MSRMDGRTVAGGCRFLAITAVMAATFATIVGLSLERYRCFQDSPAGRQEQFGAATYAGGGELLLHGLSDRGDSQAGVAYQMPFATILAAALSHHPGALRA